MVPTELRDTLRQQPFEKFRIVMTDGETFEIEHPDLLWVGASSAYVGLTGGSDKTLFERSVKIDLDHVIRTEPVASPAAPSNGKQ